MKTKLVFLEISLLVLLIGVSNCLPLACRNKNNEVVDWWIALKAPNGTKYIYIDSQNANQFSDLQNNIVDKYSSPLFITMNQELDLNTTEFGNFMYNDDPANTTDPYTWEKGHTKGFTMFDMNSGYFIQHSSPKFPYFDKSNQLILYIAVGQTMYAQHFFCMTMSTENIEKLAEAMIVNQPRIYHHNIPDQISQRYPSFKQLVTEKKPEVDYASIQVSTLSGLQLTVLSQFKNWLVPFYEYVAATNLGVGLTVESWGNNGGYQAPDFDFANGTLPVISSLWVTFKENFSFSSFQDHSKYAVSTDPSHPILCMSDINRQESQYQRGGGCICFQHKGLYNIFKSAMVQVQEKNSTIFLAEQLSRGNFLKKEKFEEN